MKNCRNIPEEAQTEVTKRAGTKQISKMRTKSDQVSNPFARSNPTKGFLNLPRFYITFVSPPGGS